MKNKDPRAGRGTLSHSHRGTSDSSAFGNSDRSSGACVNLGTASILRASQVKSSKPGDPPIRFEARPLDKHGQTGETDRRVAITRYPCVSATRTGTRNLGYRSLLVPDEQSIVWWSIAS